jgi:dihydrofolate synthase/folylpolyglutamate synthase
LPEPDRRSTLAEWLAWLETLHPKKIDLSLNRIRTVLESMQLETPPFRVITVAGTNGKGSCVAYLEAIYRQAGFRVGAFTSPHLVRFNERVAIDGRFASDEDLVEAFWVMNRARGNATLSYFESSAVAAFHLFARAEVDVAVLEVGMGGRLDAVNVYDADAALIVSIGLDHTEWLGNDRESIGFEKAGVMREGRPVIVADADPPQSIFSAVARTGAEGYLIGRDFRYERDDHALRICCRNGDDYRVPVPAFGGEEQLVNASACVQLVDSLQAELPVSPEAVAAGIAAARVPGRMHSRTIDGVEWLFDVAHNPAAAARLAAHVAERPRAERTLAVFGAMRDKDLAGVIAPFVSGITHWYVGSVASERSASAEQLEQTLRDRGIADVSAYETVEAACAAAQRAARPGDRVVVFGSFYTVGPALVALEIYFAPPG